MENVSSNLHLERRKGTYYYRRRVPDFAIGIVGKAVLKYSLKTHDKKVASARREVEDLKWTRRFEAIGGGAKLVADPSSVHIGASVENIVRDYVAAADTSALASLQRDPPSDQLEKTETKIDAEIELGILRNASDTRAAEWIMATERELAKRLGSARAISPGALAQLPELVRRALMELSRRKIARLDDDFSHAFFDQFFASQSLNTATFGELADQYLATSIEEAKANGISRKRTDKVEANVALIREIVGDATAASRIDYDQCQKVRSTLARTPTNRGKLYGKKPLDQAIAAAQADGRPTLSATTQGQYLDAFRNILELATLKRIIPHNPARSIRPLTRETVTASQKRLPFSLEQIQAFFTSDFYRRCAAGSYAKADREWRFWLPLLCLFMGLRPNEACQMLTSDISRTAAGTWFVDIAETADDDLDEKAKTLKTDASRRKIPLHPEVIAAGFLELVEERRTDRLDGRIFHTLRPDHYGNHATYALKRFRDSFLPAAIPVAPRQSFYSFRHSFRDALRRIDAQPATLQALGGWSQGKLVSDNYGDQSDPDYQAPWIAKVTFPGLDLSFLSTHDP